MVETLLKAWPFAVPALLIVLSILAYCRVRVFRAVAEVTTRDEGRYWQSLPWEQRFLYRRKINIVSWAFVILFVLTLFYGVWLHWYGLKFGPF